MGRNDFCRAEEAGVSLGKAPGLGFTGNIQSQKLSGCVTVQDSMPEGLAILSLRFDPLLD